MLWMVDEYSEILNFNPQTEYFQKKVKSQLFKKCYFWGCDVENWLWAKLALWICPILWKTSQICYRQLSLTFFHYYRPVRPIYHTSKKSSFRRKIMIFRSKICSKRARTGATANSKTIIVPSLHKHPLQTHNVVFFICAL